jgi:hypothetical protein
MIYCYSLEDPPKRDIRATKGIPILPYFFFLEPSTPEDSEILPRASLEERPKSGGCSAGKIQNVPDFYPTYGCRVNQNHYIWCRGIPFTTRCCEIPSVQSPSVTIACNDHDKPRKEEKILKN